MGDKLGERGDGGVLLRVPVQTEINKVGGPIPGEEVHVGKGISVKGQSGVDVDVKFNVPTGIHVERRKVRIALGENRENKVREGGSHVETEAAAVRGQQHVVCSGVGGSGAKRARKAIVANDESRKVGELGEDGGQIM